VAQILTTFSTGGTPDTVVFPDINDFMFIYLPENLVGKVPDYEQLRNTCLGLDAVAPIEKIVGWLNDKVDEFMPTYFGGLDFWLSKRAAWWDKTPMQLRQAFVSTWLPFIKITSAPDISKDIYGFPVSDILDVLAEAGAIHLLAVPREQITAPDEERTLKYVEDFLTSLDPVQEENPSAPPGEPGVQPEGSDCCTGEVCSTPGQDSDGTTSTARDSSCCGGGCCGD
jgi:hypothetical protein